MYNFFQYAEGLHLPECLITVVLLLWTGYN